MAAFNLLCVSVFSEFAQYKRDQALQSDSARFASSHMQKEKEDAERARDELKVRMGTIWPQPLLATTPFGITSVTNPALHAQQPHGHIDRPSTGTSGVAGYIDTAAGARAVQQQLANIRQRNAGGEEH